MLDPNDREFGHYAMLGWWRLPANEATNEYGDHIYDTELCETYGVAFVVVRGRWYTPGEFQKEHPDFELARVTLSPSW